MNVVVGSAHRNVGKQAARYMEQIARLRAAFAGLANLRVVAVEGDSKDNSRQILRNTAQARRLELDLVVCEHGGPEFGSTEAPERMRALSCVGNAIFDAVRDSDDVLLYVESDLSWSPSVMVCLSQYVTTKKGGFDVFAPMVMAGQCFYDIWGYRGLDGRRFSPHYPFYPGLQETDFFEIGSAGSCMAIPGDAARACRIRNDDCLVGWCADARAAGYRIAAVPYLNVRQA